MSVTGPGDPLPISRVLSHLAVMGAVSVVMGVIAAGLAIPLAGVLGLGARDMSNSLDNLPAELQTEALPQKTRILDGSGRLIASLYDENRVNVQLKDVSRTMVKAIVSIEDYRFYTHGALDLKGTVRALVTNQASDGVVQGGSSITQQMVKLTLLQQANTPEERKAATDDTYARKLRELRYAIAFEKKYSKDWILERYLNIAYFGDGAFGVQSAARHYFNKNASKLNLRESAMLAGLVKNPTGYDPTNYPDRAVARRNVVIDRMAELNVITAAKANRTKSQPLGLDIKKTKNGCVNSRAPFFCDYVVNYLLHDQQLGKTPRERKQFLYSGGLTINTTVDMRFQKAADSSVASHVYPTDQAIGGLAEVEPGTGNVKAIAQSRPMGIDAKNGQTYLNYVVPKEYGDANGFQAGSTFKAFVLSAAIEQDIPLNHSINAPPTILLNESDFEDCDHKPYGYGTWSVENSTDSGTMNLYTGTRLSVNTFYAQLEEETGICQPFNLARKMGVRLTQPLPNKHGYGGERIPSFTLGVADVSPLEMAEAYATFGARGLHCDSRPVTSIQDSSHKTLKKYPKACQQVLPSPVADAVNDVLRGVQEGGGFGASAGLALDKPSAGKTGTTSENKAVWFVGYTPHLATASMIAGANSVGHPIALNYQTVGGQYVASAHGSTTAGPMWGDAMHAIQQFLPYEDFVAPSSEDIRGVLVPVPQVYGLSFDGASARLRDAGFTPVSGGAIDSAVPAGTVVGTSPVAGSLWGSGSSVTIYISDGTPKKPKKPHRHGNGHGNGHGPGPR
jgi:membrane peptidoglycan carboxypeptidase